MEDEGVIQLNSEAKHTLTIKQGEGICFHRGVVLSEQMRTVECSGCGAVLDPFAVLLEYAKQERQLGWSRKALQKTKEEMAELKKEERRIKQRIARAKKKIGEKK
jgi:hypothetical protein